MVSKSRLVRKKAEMYFEDLLYHMFCSGHLPNEWQMDDEYYLNACVIILHFAWKSKVCS